MVKQDFIDGLRLYVSYKMNVDPWLWLSNGPHGSTFRKNIYLILLNQYFPAIAARLVVGIKGYYSPKELAKAKYNVVIYNELNRLVMDFCEAFRDAEADNDLFSGERFVNTKVPMHLINHFKVGDLGKLIIPRYSAYYDHPWVRSYIENPLGYLKGEWSQPTEISAVNDADLLYPTPTSGGVAQYIDGGTAVTVNGYVSIGDIVEAVREEMNGPVSSIPGAW